MNSSIKTELDNFHQLVTGQEIPFWNVTKGAFCRARKKIKHDAFIELNEILNNFFYSNHNYNTWQGFRLLAVDGSTFQIPEYNDIREYFDPHNKIPLNQGGYGRLSQLFDPLNNIIIDSKMFPITYGDREMLISHLPSLKNSDLLLLDSGYPSYWTFSALLDKNKQFCARVSTTFSNEVKKFVASGELEKISVFKATNNAKKMCKELGLNTEPIKLRLIRIDIGKEEPEILVTSLRNSELFTHDMFKALYHLRWFIEENYKSLKSRIKFENFSGRTIHSINLDFHASVFSKNLSSVLSFGTEKIIDENTKNCEYQYQLNFTYVFGKMKDLIVKIFKFENVIDLLILFQAAIVTNPEPIRVDRSFERKKKHNKRFNPNYKPIC